MQKGNLSGSGLYAVSVYPEFGKSFDHIPNDRDISEFIDAHIILLREVRNSLGGWCEGEGGNPPCFLDISRTLSDQSLAVHLGQICNQVSVAVLAKPVEFIKTGGNGETLSGTKLDACKDLRNQ